MAKLKATGRRHGPARPRGARPRRPRESQLAEMETRFLERRRAELVQGATLLGELGRGERALLEWVLQLCTRTLDGLSDQEWSALLFQLQFLAQHQAGAADILSPWNQSPPSDHERAAIRDLQRELRALLEQFARGESYACEVPAGRWVFLPPPRRSSGSRKSGPVVRSYSASPSAVVLAVIDMLDHVGADLLRSCAFQGSPRQPACGKLFLAKRPDQDFCIKAHAQRTAWLRWWRETQGGTRAKK